MLEKKVCMLGDYGVGKRSLTSRFEDPFSDKNYVRSISMRICNRTFEVEGRPLKMMVWDITDDDRFRTTISLLRGMSGYLLVADGTRPKTVERARDIFEQIWSFEQPRADGKETASYVDFPYRKIPFLLLLNKCDLTAEWKIDPSFLRMLANKAWPVEVVSAKENKGVDEAFLRLAREMLACG
jgi:GTPase SAR1 family protein